MKPWQRVACLILLMQLMRQANGLWAVLEDTGWVVRSNRHYWLIDEGGNNLSMILACIFAAWPRQWARPAGRYMLAFVLWDTLWMLIYPSRCDTWGFEMLAAGLACLSLIPWRRARLPWKRSTSVQVSESPPERPAGFYHATQIGFRHKK